MGKRSSSVPSGGPIHAMLGRVPSPNCTKPKPLALPSHVTMAQPQAKALPTEVPIGRAYDVIESRRKPALIVAGQSAAASSTNMASSHEAQIETQADAQRALHHYGIAEASATGDVANNIIGGGAEEARLMSSGYARGRQLANEPMLATVANHLAQEGAVMPSGNDHDVNGGTFLGGQTLCPAYQLPHKTAHIYKEQVTTALNITPRTLVFNARKWQAERPLVVEPFARSVRKLPEKSRPQSGVPTCGPLGSPNEPVWSELSHRLQVILKRQGRRAERRRKRRIQSKLFHGKSKKAEMRNEGVMLREYLDTKKAEHASGTRAPPGLPDGEFLEKVHEQYILRKDALETKPFRYLGNSGRVVDVHGMPSAPPRAAPVVRPIYCPPPPGRY